MRPAFLALLLLVVVGPARAGDDVRVDDLRAFARLYGSVPFFPPADEAAVVDSRRLAVCGAGQAIAAVREGRDEALERAIEVVTTTNEGR